MAFVPIDGTGSPEASTEPSATAVQVQLKRLLSSGFFSRSVRLSRFLTFGVESTLAGRGAVNEYAIGVDVFDRGDDFDPRVDPIVRVHARRLRSKLAMYYETEGANDPIEIQLPMRSYMPVFRPRNKCPVPRMKQNPTLHPGQHGQDSIAVFPFLNLTPNQDDDYFGEGLTREIVHSLVEEKIWRVVSWTGQERRPDVQRIGLQMNVQAALWGTLRKFENRVRISVELMSISDWTVLWSRMCELEVDSVITTQERIARIISRALQLRFKAHLAKSKKPPASVRSRSRLRSGR